MKRLSKLVALVTLATTLSTSAGTLSAACCPQSTCGSGYEDCCAAPTISPTVALGAVAVVAVVAVLVQNKKSSSNGNGGNGDSAAAGHGHGSGSGSSHS